MKQMRGFYAQTLFTFRTALVVGCKMFFSACFVVTYCRVCFVQFLSGVSILTNFLCLLGIDELYIHVTVHRNRFLFK